MDHSNTYRRPHYMHPATLAFDHVMECRRDINMVRMALENDLEFAIRALRNAVIEASSREALEVAQQAHYQARSRYFTAVEALSGIAYWLNATAKDWAEYEKTLSQKCDAAHKSYMAPDNEKRLNEVQIPDSHLYKVV